LAEPVSVQAVNSTVIYLKYDNGNEGEIDLDKTIERNKYEELKNNDEFSKVFLDGKSHDISWPCGIQLCKNALFKQLELINLLKRLKLDIEKYEL